MITEIMTMTILSEDCKTLVNYNNIISIDMQETYRQYAATDTIWQIIATYCGGSHKTLAAFNTEQECKNTFDKLCNKIKMSRESDTIDLGDLWDD